MSDPTPIAPDVMAAKIRQLEARMAQVVDRIDIYGPPPKRLPIPELSREQKVTVKLALAFVVLLTIRAVYAVHAATKGVVQ